MQSFLYLLKAALIIIGVFVFLFLAILISRKVALFIDNKIKRRDKDVKKTD